MRFYLLFLSNNPFTRNYFAVHRETFKKAPEIIFLLSEEKF